MPLMISISSVVIIACRARFIFKVRALIISPALLLAASILGNKYPQIRRALEEFRQNRTQSVLENPDPS